MASKLLTDSLIKSLRGKPKQYAQNDGDGLSLLVLPNGTMSWRYRYRFAGKLNAEPVEITYERFPEEA